MLLISGYLGTLEVDKAFNVFKSFDVDKINKNDLSLMVMELSKCVRRFIGIENKSEEGFIGLYDEINRWLPMIARHADAAAILIKDGVLLEGIEEERERSYSCQATSDQIYFLISPGR